MTRRPRNWLSSSAATPKRSEPSSATAKAKYKVIARGVDLPTKDAVLEYANTKRALNEGDPEEEWETVLEIYTEESATPQLSVRVVSVLGARLHQRRRRGHLRP